MTQLENTMLILIHSLALVFITASLASQHGRAKAFKEIRENFNRVADETISKAIQRKQQQAVQHASHKH